jgi:hypothetical protein
LLEPKEFKVSLDNTDAILSECEKLRKKEEEEEEEEEGGQGGRGKRKM